MKPPLDLEAIRSRNESSIKLCSCSRCQQDYQDRLALIEEVERLTKEVPS